MLYSILTLIVDTVASLLVGALLLRFWMQVVQIRPPSSVAQFTFQLTDWMVKPLRRLLPGLGGYDWASLVGAFLIIILSLAVNLLLAQHFSPKIVALLALLRLFKWMLYGFMALLVIDVIFSWVNPHAPLAPFVRALNNPFMRPFRRFIPPIGNVDITPMVVFILFQIVLQVVLPNLAELLVGPQFYLFV